jgi:hypothetical protein
MGLLEREYMKQRTDAESELSDELPNVEHSPEAPKKLDPFVGMVSERLPLPNSNGHTSTPAENRIETASINQASRLPASSKAAWQFENRRLPKLNVYILIIVVLVAIITVLVMR